MVANFKTLFLPKHLQNVSRALERVIKGDGMENCMRRRCRKQKNKVKLNLMISTKISILSEDWLLSCIWIMFNLSDFFFGPTMLCTYILNKLTDINNCALIWHLNTLLDSDFRAEIVQLLLSSFTDGKTVPQKGHVTSPWLYNKCLAKSEQEARCP